MSSVPLPEPLPEPSPQSSTEQPRTPREPGFLSSLALFLLVCGVAGVLIAGLALPAVGTLGLAARASTTSFENQPGTLERLPLAQSSRLLAADGSTIATFYAQDRIDVKLSQVAPVMRQAIIAIEDDRFYEHGGADLRGTVRALVNNRSGEQVQGGSTLTQQYVKQILLNSALDRGDEQAAKAATERSYARKLRELRYAVEMENELSKDQILEGYLNIAYFGAGAYGVEAAARRYFDKPAARLTLPEAALLAGLVQSPSAYDPLQRPKEAKARRDVVLARMAQLGDISPAEARKAQHSKLGLRPGEVGSGCPAAKMAGFFCDYVKRLVESDRAFGKTRADRTRMLFRGGLTIQSTLDPVMQRAADAALAKRIKRTDKAAGVVAMVQPGTGAIKAMAVSRTFGEGKGATTVNLAADYDHGRSAGTQAGSTFKAFLDASALKKGYGFDYKIHSPYRLSRVGPIKTCHGVLRNIKRDDGSPYQPTNETTAESGTFTMRQALAKSINTYHVALQAKVGICDAATLAERMGVRQAAAGAPPLLQVPSFTLGTNEVAPLNMAEAYATFAARGLHCPATAIVKVTGRDGKEYPLAKPECSKVLEPGIADGMNALLAGVVKNGTGVRADIGRPQAGKTGTIDDRRAVWFMGYTPEMAAAVAVWGPNPGRRPYKLAGVRIGGQYYGLVRGANLPAPIWADTMRKALADVPKTKFTPPPASVVHGTKSGGGSVDTRSGVVPDVTGLYRSAAIAAIQGAGLRWRISSTATGGAPGQVLSTVPGAGIQLLRGDEVTLVVSR